MPRTSKVELPGCPRFRALCCDSLGLIKVIEAGVETEIPKVVARWGVPDLRQGIRCISLSSDTSPRLAVARKTNTLEILDPASGALHAQFVVTHESTHIHGRGSREGSHAVCGLHLFSECSSCGPAVLTCTEHGDAALRRLSNEGELSPAHDDDDSTIVKWNITPTGTGSVLCMSVHDGEQYAVFGGKGVDVNVWDTANNSKLWSGKSPHRDNLGLISPAWVTAARFLRKDDHRKVVVGTGHHQVRLYDVCAQRRPVLAFDYGESPIKTISGDPDGNSVYVGTGSGDLGCFDMRTGKLVGGFKGKCAGSIRSIARHPVLPLIASCGLDRYLRIHNTKTRQLLASLFLKQELVAVVFDIEENMSNKSSTLESDTPGSEPTIAAQVEEEGDEAKLDAGRHRMRLVEKRMKAKRESLEPSAAHEHSNEDQENGLVKNRSRPGDNRVKVKRADRERKALKLIAKRQKAEP